ncbi:MAG: hypothetical protein QOH55_647 [Microbacteriaceae bacterium]|nr:hypothetical protein [Microbacteriaceae bacterium]
MDRFWPTTIVVVFTALVLWLMTVSWRRRVRRDAALVLSHDVPTELGDELATVDAFYVATTAHRVPLERLAIKGLGFRGRASVRVATAGVVLGIAGESDVFIPAGAIVEVANATWTIDRVVEKDGLVLLAWSLGGASTPSTGDAAPETIVDSYLRVIAPEDRTRLIDAIHQISPAPFGAGNTTESEV